MLAVEPALLGAVEEPYPGLRAFETHESLLFFGRRAHTEALLERLDDRRFLAVVGTSGSGKSSLVRAGLLPALYRGDLSCATSRWRVALMRPGESPLLKLAEALSAESALGRGDQEALRKTLGKTSLGLIQAVRDAALPATDNVLVVVDQFEELFRFAGGRSREKREAEASLFVASLLEATCQVIVPIYVVLTMRSDFLGDCARFAGLPEALNESQYLIPRLTRAQRQEAIEGPLRVASVQISPVLVQRVLNEVGDEPDQLPVLQHALMRTFRCWRKRARKDEVNLEDYESAGGMTEALDRHATEVYESLPDEVHRKAAERVFRCLTTVEKGRPVRRPASLERIHAVTGAVEPISKAMIRAVIERFAAKENSFLLSSTGAHLAPESILDISHESLIARWTLLGAWVLREVRAAESYRYLSRDASLHPSVSLWRDPELKEAEEYVREGEWNEAWARQYDEGEKHQFEEALAFLRESRRVDTEERALAESRRLKEIEDARKLAAAESRAKRWFGSFAVLLTLLLATTLGAWFYVSSERLKRVELLSRLSDVEKLKDDAAQKISLLEAAGGQNAAEIDELRKKISSLESEATYLQTTAQQKPAPDKGAEALIQSLQDQLRQARQERDDAMAKLEKGPSVSSYPDDRLQKASSRIRELEAALADARPTAVILPQNSLLPFEPGRTSGRVGFLLGDAARSKGSTLDLFVITEEAAVGTFVNTDGFRNDAKRAAAFLNDYGNPMCADYTERASGRGVWCFRVEKQRVLHRTQDLGKFRAGGLEYGIVAMGWSEITSGVEALSLSVFRVYEGAAKSAK